MNRCKTDHTHNEFIFHVTEVAHRTVDRRNSYLANEFIETLEMDGPVRCAVCGGDAEDTDEDYCLRCGGPETDVEGVCKVCGNCSACCECGTFSE